MFRLNKVEPEPFAAPEVEAAPTKELLDSDISFKTQAQGISFFWRQDTEYAA